MRGTFARQRDECGGQSLGSEVWQTEDTEEAGDGESAVPARQWAGTVGGRRVGFLAQWRGGGGL
jgi:hypothetical protein